MVDLKPPSVQEAVAADALFPTETVEEGWKGHKIPLSPYSEHILLLKAIPLGYEARQKYLQKYRQKYRPKYLQEDLQEDLQLRLSRCLDQEMFRRTAELNTPKIPSKLESSKAKRGVSGFANGRRVSALPDTGSLRNIVSQTFAREMNLEMKDAPSTFRLGNSKEVRSLDWAFLDRPKTLSKIVCDVLPDCTYPLILGSQFLAATQTLSKYKSRLTKCLFSLANVLHVNLLGGDTMRIRGRVGQDRNAIAVSAVPDTGAEGNVMSYEYEESLRVYHQALLILRA
ncbi:MAG: hypothetical protein Q9211_000887 [Gyalolechia sp. 1 TL-2023]